MKKTLLTLALLFSLSAVSDAIIVKTFGIEMSEPSSVGAIVASNVNPLNCSYLIEAYTHSLV